MTADVTREPTGGQELHQALKSWLVRTDRDWTRIDPRDPIGARAESLLALPELAAVVADAERVRRVNSLCDTWENRGDLYEKAGEMWRAGRLRQRAADVRRALSEPQP